MQEALKQVDVTRAELERQRKNRPSDCGNHQRCPHCIGAMEVGRAVRTDGPRERQARPAWLCHRRGDLQALLLLRRQSVDAVGASLSSRIEALKARNRLLVDAHLIWG